MKISSHTTRSAADCGPRLLSFVHPTAPEPETATAGPRVSGGVAKSRNAADCGSRHLSLAHPPAWEPETASAGPRVSGGVSAEAIMLTVAAITPGKWRLMLRH